MNKQERLQAFLGLDQKKEGGGLTLPALFGPVLDHLADYGETHIGDVIDKIVRGHPSGTKRIENLFGSVQLCIEEIFYHLADKRYATLIFADGGYFLQKGAAVETGVTLELFNAKDFQKEGASIKYTVYSQVEREQRESSELRRLRMQDWLRDMERDNYESGFRQLVAFSNLDNAFTYRRLDNALRNNGYNPFYKIIVDDQGHVIDGKRRLLVCHKLNIKIPQHCIQVFEYASDEDRLLHAWQLNQGTTWGKHLYTEQCDREFTEQRLRLLGITDLERKPNCSNTYCGFVEELQPHDNLSERYVAWAYDGRRHLQQLGTFLGSKEAQQALDKYNGEITAKLSLSHYERYKKQPESKLDPAPMNGWEFDPNPDPLPSTAKEIDDRRNMYQAEKDKLTAEMQAIDTKIRELELHASRLELFSTQPLEAELPAGRNELEDYIIQYPDLSVSQYHKRTRKHRHIITDTLDRLQIEGKIQRDRTKFSKSNTLHNDSLENLDYFIAARNKGKTETQIAEELFAMGRVTRAKSFTAVPTRWRKAGMFYERDGLYHRAGT